MKLWTRTKLKAVCELNIENVVAGVVIGDDWVQAVIVHIDPRGAVYPIRTKARRIKTQPGLIPSLDDVCKAVVSCWKEILKEGPLDYSRFVLGLPPWCLGSRDTFTEFTIDCDERLPTFRLPKIRGHHVRELEKAASTADLPRHSVPVELVPLAYVLQGNRRIIDPRGLVSDMLKLHARVVFADLGTVLGLLDCLHDQGLRVNTMMAPHTAAEVLLTNDEKHLGTVVIDVGQRYTLCSLYHNGLLRYTARTEGGIKRVYAEIAHRLGTTSDRVAAYIRDKEPDISAHESDHSIRTLPLFRSALMPRSTKGLEDAAFPAANEIFQRTTQCVKRAADEMKIRFRSMVLLGDDPITLRVLKFLAEEQLLIRGRITRPQCVLGIPQPRTIGRTRTLSFFQQAVQGTPRRQVFLDQYNQNPLDTLARRFSDKATDASRRVLHRIADTAFRKAEPASAPASPEPAPVPLTTHEQLHAAIVAARERHSSHTGTYAPVPRQNIASLLK